MTVSLYGASDTQCAGTPVYSQTFILNANGNYVTTNGGAGAAANGATGTTAGYSITADGTYRWKIHYNGDSRNESFDIACGDEQVFVGVTPDPAP